MDKSKLIELLKDAWNDGNGQYHDCKHNWEYKQDLQNWLDNNEDNINELCEGNISNSKHANCAIFDVSNWVATSKMPEFDGLYLCYIKQTQECGNVWEYCKVVDCNYNKWIVQTNEEVTHWRSLPKPPCC